jgi:hypothetical protein
VDAGFQGRISDRSVLRNPELEAKMEKDSLGFPPPADLTGINKTAPYFLLLMKDSRHKKI